MAVTYGIVTSDSVSVLISSSKEEKCIPIEKHFKKSITVKELKEKLEVITGASSATMTVKVYDDDKLVGLLDKEDALLGSYHVDSGMRLHIEDSFTLSKALEDESNVEKYMMSPEEYNKRDENRAERTSSSVVQSVPSVKSRGRGLVRKNHAERLNAVEVKTLRRPTVQPNAKILENFVPPLKNVSSSSGPCQPFQNTNDVIEQRMASLSVDIENQNTSVIHHDSVLDSEDANSSNLNPNAEEFVPRLIKQGSESTARKSEGEFVGPSTGQSVSINDCSDDLMIYGRDEFSDDIQVLDVIQAVSVDALRYEEFSQSEIKYEKEVNDVLDSIENLLTNSPGLFSSIVTALSGIFCRWVSFDKTLEVVACKIIDQSISNNSYAYFGAKVCASLDRITLSIERCPSFRFFVLNECESLFNQLKVLIEIDYRAHNIIMFFAELFIQLNVKNMTRIESLGCGILESLNLLLLNPTSENIRCVCKILKLSGWALDEDQPILTKKLLNDLTKLKVVNSLDTQTINVLNSVINLASISWGRSMNNNSSSPYVSSSNNLSVHYDCEKVSGKAYGPDGAVLTDEESKFLYDNCKTCDYDDDSEEHSNFDCGVEDDVVSDDMDEEACEAYEQFLLTVPGSDYCNRVNNLKK